MNQVVLFECPDCATPLPLDVTLGQLVQVGDGIVEVQVDGGITDVWAQPDLFEPRGELLTMPEPIVEHAIMMSGGGMQVRNGDPEIEDIFPLAKWIPAQQRFGGKVYRRTVIVVEDWEEVPR